jgi:DNA-binding transcriptional MerR regulator
VIAVPETRLTIGEVAERTGLTVHTLRFYEREGLLAGPVPRERGRRVYSPAHVEWLEMCKALRAAGMPLPAIARFAEFVRRGANTETEQLRMLHDHQDRLAVELQELTERMAQVGRKISCYESAVAAGE